MGVLDDMTKGITERKAAKTGPKLTPVGVEASSTKPSIPEVPEVFLTNEAVRDISVDLRKQAGLLIEVADALDARTGELTSPPAPVEDNKAAEKKADEAAAARKAAAEAEEEFPDRLKRLREEAEAATFTKDLPDVAVDVDGWTCPDHGAKDLKQLTSRANRLYMACQVKGCGKFEK